MTAFSSVRSQFITYSVIRRAIALWPISSSGPHRIRAARADLVGIADKLEPRSGAAAVVTVEQFLIRGLGTACQSVRRGAASAWLAEIGIAAPKIAGG